MASFTLDDIRAAAEKKYGSYDIVVDESTTVTLRNVLRLSKEERQELTRLQESLEAQDGKEGADVSEFLVNAIRLVAKPGSPVDRLLAATGEDAAILSTIFEGYTGETQAGEAQPSQS